MKFKYKTRWLRQKEFEALEKVVAYLHDEQKEFEARKEHGEPTRGHIGKAVKVLAAYVEEIDGSLSAASSTLGDQLKRDFRAGKPFALPEKIFIASTEPNLKRPRVSLEAYGFKDKS